MRLSQIVRIGFRSRHCVYCGETANTEEHFPPSSVTSWGFLLSACAECNYMASDRHPFDIKARCAHVHARLRTRYQTALAVADWTEDDLSELDERLAEDIRQWLRQKDRIERRLAWCVGQCLSSTALGSLFAASSVSSITTIYEEKLFLARLEREERQRLQSLLSSATTETTNTRLLANQASQRRKQEQAKARRE